MVGQIEYKEQEELNAILFERRKLESSGYQPKMDCPECGEQLRMFIMHEIYCPFCDAYIGCND